MKRTIITLSVVVAVIIGIIILKNTSYSSNIIWSLSDKGTWLLPLVFFSSLLDSVHPCSFSILLITIAFLFGMNLSRRKILQVGGVYVAGIFSAYFLIGLGILRVLHLFNTPHFMGKLGASLLLLFGIINILSELFPNFPIKLKVPSALYEPMAKLMEKTSVVAAFALGLLVGICQFPCMGGPYLMVIGLLKDQVTYFTGFAYLLLYNLILVTPLVAVLFVAGDKTVIDKVQNWRANNTKGFRLYAGIIMVILALVIFLM